MENIEYPKTAVGDCVGRGKYAVVAKLGNAAVKMSRGKLYSIANEVVIISKLSHPRIVRFFDICTIADHPCYTMEYCRTTLRDILAATELTYDYVHAWSRQLIEGIYYLHQNGITHCDIKVDNILVSDLGGLKLCDFGMSFFGPRYVGLSTNMTFSYAPEFRVTTRPIAFTPDIWGAALVILHMARCPLYGQTIAEGLAIARDYISGVGKKYLSPECAEFVHRALVFGPATRITSAEAARLFGIQAPAVERVVRFIAPREDFPRQMREIAIVAPIDAYFLHVAARIAKIAPPNTPSRVIAELAQIRRQFCPEFIGKESWELFCKIYRDLDLYTLAEMADEYASKLRINDEIAHRKSMRFVRRLLLYYEVFGDFRADPVKLIRAAIDAASSSRGTRENEGNERSAEFSLFERAMTYVLDRGDICIPLAL